MYETVGILMKQMNSRANGRETKGGDGDEIDLMVTRSVTKRHEAVSVDTRFLL